MKKILLLSIHGTSLMDYRIVSQAVFLKQNGFDVTIFEAFPLAENIEHNIYLSNNIKFASSKPNLYFILLRRMNFNKINKLIREIIRPIYRILKKLNERSLEHFIAKYINKCKPDIVISRDITPNIELINKDIKIVNDLHEIYYYQTGNVHQNLKRIQDQSLLRASFIINVTPQIAQSFYSDFWKSGKSIIIPNAPLLSFVNSKVPTFAKSEHIKFLIHGSYVQIRDKLTKDVILSFINAPENVKLYVRFINFKDASVINLKEIVSKLDTRKQIIFLDPVQNGIKAEVESMIDNFDIGIVSLDTTLAPQYKMASPNRLGTYMHSGLAVISNKSDFVEEVIKSANCGLIYEPDKIIDCINYLSTNPEEVLEMRRNAFSFAKSTFNYDNYGKQLMEKLNSI